MNEAGHDDRAAGSMAVFGLWRMRGGLENRARKKGPRAGTEPIVEFSAQ